MDAKTVIERVVVDSGLARLLAVRASGWGLVLAYHNVLPDGVAPAGDRSLHLARSAFVEQIDWIARHCAVVPLADVVADGHGGGRRRVAITFDDAYRGAVTVALPELARRGLPATMFVVPGAVGAVPGQGHTFWWDRFASADGLDPAFRTHALDALGGSDQAVGAWATSDGRRPSELGPAFQVASEGELVEAARFDGLTLGSHTWSHPNLARVSAADAPGELARPLEWLRARFARVLPWLSYPYGIANPALDGAVRGAGYTGAVLVSGGARRAQVDPLRTPRLNVPAGLSVRGLALRFAGLLGG
jgi:peptidoglycan/xylan/chitin deacetylase (PgdA/CDA1 family)